MNHFKTYSNKAVLIIFLFLSPYLLTNEESPDSEKEEEEKEVYIEEIVKEFEELKGFFVTYRDPKTNDIYLKIKQDQLNEEFIYFAHVMNGIVSAGLI